MKPTTIFLCLLFPALSWAQQSHISNPYTSMSYEVVGKQYSYLFTFKDHKNRLLTWAWNFNRQEADDLENRLGFPIEPNEADSIDYQIDHIKTLVPKNTELEKRMAKGMFHLSPPWVDDPIEVDFNEAISVYDPFVKPIYLLIENTLKNVYQEKPNWNNRLKLALSFVQDIPNFRPMRVYEGKVIEGVFSPPTLFKNGYSGDEGKIILLAAILSYYKDDYSLYIVYQKGRSLLAVKDKNRSREYPTISIEKALYIPLEVEGPQKKALGGMLYPDMPLLGFYSVNPPKIPVTEKKSMTAQQEAENYNLSIKTKGFLYKLSVTDENKRNLTGLLMVSELGDNLYYRTPIENMPYEDNLYYYGSEKKSLVFSFEQSGYFFKKELFMEDKKKEQQFHVDFSEAMIVDQLVPLEIYRFWRVLDHVPTGVTYEVLDVTAPSSGVIRLILPNGTYYITEKDTPLKGVEKAYVYKGSRLYIENF